MIRSPMPGVPGSGLPEIVAPGADSRTAGAAQTDGTPRVAYDFAVLRVVPNVATGACANVGVILHARTAEFLALRVLRDPAALRALCAPGTVAPGTGAPATIRAPELDIDLLARYLAACEAICRGDDDAGPVALTSPSERFHWLTAPRSDVLQCSPVHEGICEDPARALEELFASYVRG